MTVTSSLLGSLRVTRHLVAPVVAALFLVSRAAAADD